jgi:hypothetical protein
VRGGCDEGGEKRGKRREGKKSFESEVFIVENEV